MINKVKNIAKKHVEKVINARRYLHANPSLSEYSSPNFLYFKKKYNDFMYIDRIAISEKYHRKGFGSLIYKELYNQSKNLGIPLCCEVNTKPINQQSLDFHKKLEFSIIEEISFGKKIVAMLVKN